MKRHTEKTNHTKFKTTLIESSTSNNYEEALKEWKLQYLIKKESNCICGQHIINNCIFKNLTNNNYITIGNVCVKKFLGVDYIKEFNIKSIVERFYTSTKLRYLVENKILTEYEREFINNVPTIKHTTIKQEELFFKLHKKVIDFEIQGIIPILVEPKINIEKTLKLESILPYGKYKGNQVRQIIMSDPNYMKWFLTVWKTGIDKSVRKLLYGK